VIGVDMNDEMLTLSRRYLQPLGEKFGFHNVSFVKARIQDLALSWDQAQHWLSTNPIQSMDQIPAFKAECDRLRKETPLIETETVDVVVSNCVLNLVKPEDKAHLFEEIFRVLKRGGRAVISDIVCDETPTEKIMQDPDLWSGCIAGAFLEAQFLEMFEQAGFHGVEILARQVEPWQVIDGIEFRSMTIRAHKGKQGPCLDRHQAVVYKGPWKVVLDDDGHTLFRGERMAVCDKTYKLYLDPMGPYAGQFLAIDPVSEVPLEEAPSFDCQEDQVRSPRVTKGEDYRETWMGESACC
jgi:arsenite methyltransferase